MSKPRWTRIEGEGYDLAGTEYGVRWSWAQSATDDTELIGSRKEWAVVRGEENISWHDSCGEAKTAAERLAAENREQKQNALARSEAADIIENA